MIHGIHSINATIAGGTTLLLLQCHHYGRMADVIDIRKGRIVSICTHNRELFLENAAVCAIAERCWFAIPEHFPIVTLDEWVVMPNYVHGIIASSDSNNDPDGLHRRGVQLNAPTANINDGNATRDSVNPHSLISPHRNRLAVIIRTYKAAVTTLCRKDGYTDFRWQRSYHERVIRDDAELNHTYQYSIDTPTHWNQDEHHAD